MYPTMQRQRIVGTLDRKAKYYLQNLTINTKTIFFYRRERCSIGDLGKILLLDDPRFIGSFRQIGQHIAMFGIRD
jgi:hypothetical protein